MEQQQLVAKLHVAKRELMTWPPRLAAAEARLPPLQASLEEAQRERSKLEISLAEVCAERRGIDDTLRRTESWATQQANKAQRNLALATVRLEAAATEGVLLLEQKEAAVDVWHRSQEALAACQAEKRAAEEARVPLEHALEAEHTCTARLEAELKALGASARSACRLMEEVSALQLQSTSVERAIDERRDVASDVAPPPDCVVMSSPEQVELLDFFS